ncbi:MAG: hypothetical protein Q7U97_11680 [Rhodocyclaceae bacterium]|nr:hypothetical protein [Rhodocyclaceae bacterium]
MKHCIAVLLGLWLSVGGAAASDSICGGFTAEQDGIRCKVAYIDGLGDTLLIRVHTGKGDSAERIAVAKAATRRAIDTFLRQGGIFIKMRTTRADGIEVERTCSKVKRGRGEHCGEWAPVAG